MHNVEFFALPFVINRAKTVDKYAKSALFIVLTPLIALLAKRNRADAIYCDDSFPFYGFLLKVFTRRKVIIRMGDLQTAYHLHGTSIISKVIYAILTRLEKTTWNRVDYIIPVSNAFQEYLRCQGVPQGKMRVVPECVDTQFFNSTHGSYVRRKHGIKDDEVLLLFHGTIEKLKGLDILLDYWSKAYGKVRNARLMLVGGGREFNKVKSVVYSLPSNYRPILVGWVPMKDIPSYVSAADIGIPMRSRNFANNFVVTTALLQYWASGKPVLAPKLNAISEIVQDGVNGFVFDGPEEFANKLKILSENETLRERLGSNGRKIVTEWFDKQRVAEMLFSALRRFLNFENYDNR